MYAREVMFPRLFSSIVSTDRTAYTFVQKASEFKSSIWVERKERRTNGKDFSGLLSLGVVGGMPIRIIADGIDEQDAVETLVELVESGFIG